MKTKPQPYDIIADIHGHADTLRTLLAKLGYVERDGAYRHPERTVIFLGDFIDRGPKIRETLQIVRAMTDAGTALAVMGNHEYNAICYHAPMGNDGDFYRPHTEKNVGQHEATMRAFEGRQDELAAYMKWFEKLPLFLDLGGLRVVHACWNDTAIRALSGSPDYDAGLLAPPDAHDDPRHAALNILIKGPEIPTPGGIVYDGDRDDMRVKWWLNDEPLTYRAAGLQVPFDLPDEQLKVEDRAKVCGYAVDAPPVFFGHYGYSKPAEAIAPNVACIDLGVAHGGPLCAYRWDGETVLDAVKFVVVPSKRHAEQPAECECERCGPKDCDKVVIGVDETNGRYGDVALEACHRCGRRWLSYFAEYESFTGSGRWILGILPEELPMPLTPQNAVPILNTLPWYIYGGSAFCLPPPGRRARGNAPADFMASPGEWVPSPYDK